MAVKSGRRVPPQFLADVPEVAPGLQLYMNGFFELIGDRDGSGKIFWSTIRSWCEAKGLVADDAQDAHFLLGRMDTTYLEWARTKGKKLSAEKARIEEAKKPKGRDNGVRYISTGVRGRDA